MDALGVSTREMRGAGHPCGLEASDEQVSRAERLPDKGLAP